MAPLHLSITQHATNASPYHYITGALHLALVKPGCFFLACFYAQPFVASDGKQTMYLQGEAVRFKWLE